MKCLIRLAVIASAALAAPAEYDEPLAQAGAAGSICVIGQDQTRRPVQELHVAASKDVSLLLFRDNLTKST
jgi:hypothetical protein